MADNMNQDVMQMDTDGASAAHSLNIVSMQDRAFSQLDDRTCSRASIHFVADLNRQPDTKNSIVMNSVGKAPGMAESKLPKAGSRVSRKTIKKAGPYILGPVVGPQPVHSIVQCLARHEVTKKCYTLKILTLKDSLDQETEDDRQGKMLMHAEHSILGLLEHEQGVINKHEFFKDYAIDEKVVESKRRKKRVYTGKIKQRLCLVLDCLINHDFNLDSENFINLQDYVISQKKLSEKETLVIFYDTVRTVAAFHAKHVIHRDLKLGNLVYNIRQRKTIITNFCLGEHKSATSDLLYDQRGSPAYIAPEVLSGKHYAGKPADMWALGVMLYTMLYGQFPFYENTPSELFNQIKSVSYVIPEDSRVSDQTKRIIKNLLALQPQKRLTATQLLNSLESVIALYRVPDTVDDKSRGEQVVPQYVNRDEAELDALCNTPAAAAKMAQIEALLGSTRGENFFTRFVTMQESMEAQMMGRGPSADEDLPLYVRRMNTQLSNISPTEFRRLIHRDNQLSEDSSTSEDSNDARDDVSMDEIDNEDGRAGASAQGSLPDQRRTTGGSFSPVNYESMNRGNADNSW
ncbi:serine/threonine-protein kinase 40-like isoform X2 [Trichogramma pretiosum]|uniref:serine/threonine-protein kinase 40-like isoform X2 n=1 Tax=Trichogramma pretiosum TaxID=7493 RepID=UPI0006C9C67D|nr:serine/threonine-protein kinase 40-like isoform X2 [Trichogramma pretiosum]